MELLEKIKESVKRKTITASEAYTLSKYNQKLTEEEIFRRAIDNINSNISIKSQNGGSSIIYEFDYTFKDMQENLVKYFTDLGYNVLILDNKISEFIKTPKMAIFWEK